MPYQSKPRLAAWRTLMERNLWLQQFGQSDDSLTNNGATGCTDTVLQAIILGAKGRRVTHDAIRKAAGRGYASRNTLIQFLIDPKTIMTGTELNWGAIPWGQIALLAGLGFILSFFLSGYTVRIYRGTTPAPDFSGWTDLFVDGIKLAVVWFLWILPLILVLAAGIAIAITTFLSTQALSVSPDWKLLVSFIALLLLVEGIRFIIIMLFGILGAVRFARTGSIREGIRFSAILTTIRTIGWVSYIILLIGYVIAMVIYAVITGILSFIPYIGWVLLLVVNPIFAIFSARYFSLVYDQGEPKTVPPVPAPAG